MHNLIYNGKSLNDLGFAIKDKPIYRVAQRDFEFLQIPGRSGDLIIDNGAYKNVALSYAINSLPFRAIAEDSQKLAYQLIDMFAPFGGYKILRDTYNKGYFTYAVCTNIDDIANKLYKYLDTTINFSRQPFWYSNNGAKPITLNNGTITLSNPELIDAEQVIELVGNGASAEVTINDDYLDMSVPVGYEKILFDCKEKQHVAYKADGTKTFISSSLPKNLKTGSNVITVADLSGSLTITPNWRRL